MANVGSIVKITITRLIGFLIFVLILFVLKILSGYIVNDVFLGAVSFLYNDFVIIMLMSLFFLFADIISQIDFPINLITPMFNALAAYFLIGFIFDIFSFIDMYVTKGELANISHYSFVITIVVILCVLVFGYVDIIKKVLVKKQKGSNQNDFERVLDEPDYEEEDFGQEDFDGLSDEKERIQEKKSTKRKYSPKKKRK